MKWFAACLALVLCIGAISCTIWENPPKGWPGATGGEQLERQFWKEAAAQNWTSVERHLANNFTLTTPAGSLGREEAVAYWKQLALENYSLGNFKLEANGADVVVSYTMARSGGTDGAGAGTDGTQVMSVWQEVGTRWVLIAQSIHPARGGS